MSNFDTKNAQRDEARLLGRLLAPPEPSRGRNGRNPPPPVASAQGGPACQIPNLFSFFQKESQEAFGLSPGPGASPILDRLGASPIGFSAQDGAKMASRTAQNGQDGASCHNMVSNMAVDGPLWLPRCLQDSPNSLQDGPGDLQGASRRAPRSQNH